MTTLAPQGPFRAFDTNGDPLNGGLLYTYVAGSLTTPKVTYTDASGTVANANPVVLDASGYANVWLDTGAYQFVLKNSSGVTQWTLDNITGAPAAAFGSQVINQTTNLAVTSAYANAIINTTGTVTLTLPLSSSVGAGFYFAVNDISGTTTLTPTGSDTVDRSTLQTGNSGIVYTNGTGGWFVAFDIPETISVGGTWTFNTLAVTNNATVGGTLGVTGNTTVGGGAGGPVLRINGGASGTANGPAIYYQENGASVVASGWRSSIVGGAFNNDFILYLSQTAGTFSITNGTGTTQHQFTNGGNAILAQNGTLTTGGATAATGYTTTGDVTLPATRSIRAKNTPKGWATMDGTATGTNAPSDGFNVTSITRNSVGDYTINFTNAMANTTYAVIGTVQERTTGEFGLTFQQKSGGTKSTTQFQFVVKTATSGTPVDPPFIYFMVLGS